MWSAPAPEQRGAVRGPCSVLRRHEVFAMSRREQLRAWQDPWRSRRRSRPQAAHPPRSPPPAPCRDCNVGLGRHIGKHRDLTLEGKRIDPRRIEGVGNDESPAITLLAGPLAEPLRRTDTELDQMRPNDCDRRIQANHRTSPPLQVLATHQVAKDVNLLYNDRVFGKRHIR